MSTRPQAKLPDTIDVPYYGSFGTYFRVTIVRDDEGRPWEVILEERDPEIDHDEDSVPSYFREMRLSLAVIGVIGNFVGAACAAASAAKGAEA